MLIFASMTCHFSIISTCEVCEVGLDLCILETGTREANESGLLLDCLVHPPFNFFFNKYWYGNGIIDSLITDVWSMLFLVGITFLRNNSNLKARGLSKPSPPLWFV